MPAQREDVLSGLYKQKWALQTFGDDRVVDGEVDRLAAYTLNYLSQRGKLSSQRGAKRRRVGDVTPVRFFSRSFNQLVAC